MNVKDFLVKNGDILICTRANTCSFIVNEEYVVKTVCGELCISDRYSNSCSCLVSEFKVKIISATNIAINETNGGENTMINKMTLEGSKVKRANESVVIEKAFDIKELTVGMQVFDTMMDKWRTVKDVFVTGFKAGDTLYTYKGKLDTRHSVAVVDRMRAKLDAEGLTTIERATINKFSTVAWNTGVKNYYVSFKTDTNEYKVFSEDKLRRIDTLFLSREDAFKACKELNKLV